MRTQILHEVPQVVHERVVFAPIPDPAFLNSVGPPSSAPYEDLTLKAT